MSKLARCPRPEETGALNLHATVHDHFKPGRLGLVLRAGTSDGLMPPDVPPFGPLDLRARAAHHQDMLDDNFP